MKVKKVIAKLLKATENNQMGVKKLKKATCNELDAEVPDKDERKRLFAETLEKMLKKGKLTEADSVISLVRQRSTSLTSTNSGGDGDDADRSQKKRKLEANDDDASNAKRVSAQPAPLNEKYIVPDGPGGNNSILLFYAYCDPQMTRAQQDKAITFCHKVLTENKVTGRLRVGREGFNATLTGPYQGVRNFTAALREYDPSTFGQTDFKYVDNQPDNQLLKGLKVWPVTEIVTYGFNPAEAPLDMRGIHLKPHEFHEALADPNAILIDVRNYNETEIGKFIPPNPDGRMLDPMMRRSTEFPKWVDDNKHLFEGKKVLMCCTAGVRCERASAFIRNRGVQNVYQLEGGIHRYLDAYPDDGGFWKGKNYVFDRRFNHGAKATEVISQCVYCKKPWERYQAGAKCFRCAIEVLLCRDCQRAGSATPKDKLFCTLCDK